MGDEEDQKRLSAMTEKEREQEIFKRIEAREVMKTRYICIEINGISCHYFYQV